MYFTECARLAERRPGLARAVQQIDAQLAQLRTGSVIRAGDLASFLGADPNQVDAVLGKLAQERLLLAEEMVECSYCRMAVLRTEYQETQEEDGEYRCTSCDQPLTDATVEQATTYRPGQKWHQIRDSKNEPSSAASPEANGTLHEEGFYTHHDLAEVFKLPKEALRKRLDRFRQQNFNGWKENDDRRPRETGYLYRLKDVRAIIEELQASSQRPAK